MGVQCMHGDLDTCRVCAEELDDAQDADAAIATLTRERDEARAKLDEREGDMHLRIRAGYDKTVADSWRAKVAEVERERDEARAEVERLRAELAWFADEGHYSGTYRQGAGYVDAVGLSRARAALAAYRDARGKVE